MRPIRLRVPAVFALFLLLPGLSWGASPPAPVGTGGAVASADPQATEAGLAMLREGGNAVDAAVATALALAVVYPEAGNLGGGGFAVIKRGEEIRTLDFREVAPAAARRDLFLDAAGKVIPGASTIGPLAAGVPGSPAGLYELHREMGKLPWPKVVAPAIRLATDGFRVDSHLNEVLGRERIRRSLERFPETRQVWYPGGEPLQQGALVRLPDLAATLRLYAEKGPEGITTGRVARAVEEASRRHGGILTAADLAAYRPVWREPLRFEAFGWQLATMPLPSSGGIILGQTLGILERLGWGRLPRFGAERQHLFAEALRRAFADRFLLGDPATSQATPAQLLDPRWLDSRAQGIDRGRVTPSKDVHPWPGGEKPAREGADTTHLSVIDRDGTLVALTTTINDLFGCGLYVPGAGFFLNNEMDDFAALPGRPNLFGLVQGEANAVGPGKKMLSSMVPTIAWRATPEGPEALALGGRGGSKIPTSTVQVLLHILVDGDPLQAALDRPRLHHQWLPDLAEIEADTLAPETRAELEKRGHTFKVIPAAEVAKIHAVRRRPDGRFEAASDPRSTGNGAVLAPEP